MSVKKIKTGVLSYGMSGRVFHTPFLEASDYFELRAIVERSSKEAYKTYPDIVSYNSVEELIQDEEIELIVVNTPNNTHYDFAKQALLAGKHVLVEKPFMTNRKDAEEVFAIAEEKGKSIFPYHNRRFDSEFLALKEVIDTHKVGQPIELHLRFDRYRQEIGPKAFKETKTPGAGILFDLGSHLIDQVISLFGMPKAYYKVLRKHRQDSEVDDYAFLLLEYDGGFQVHITTTMLALDPQPSIVLHGTKGSFVKDREDPQEKQLIDGMLPSDVRFGIEREGAEGILSYVDGKTEVKHQKVASLKGNYMQVFDEVYATLRENKKFFVTQGDIYCQLDILGGPKNKRVRFK